MNMITAKSPQGARVPITVSTDRQALTLAVASALKVTEGSATFMRIPSTKDLETLWLSVPVLDELRASGAAIEVVEDVQPIAFDDEGMFISSS
jgi:hypothetical protein